MKTSNLSDQDFWQQVHRRRPIDSIKKCEEAAKQLITLTALLSTVYFSLLSFSSIADRLINLFLWARLILLVPLVCWLTSLVLAILVIMPREVNVDTEDLPEMFNQASRNKYSRVRSSYIFLIASIVALALLTVLFLFQPNNPMLIPPLQPPEA
jgi:uncharacterized membrane protein